MQRSTRKPVLVVIDCLLVPTDPYRHLNRTQMNLAKQYSVVVFILLIGILYSRDDLDAQDSPKPHTTHSSTQDGITVHLEKVTVDRILNSSGWLKAKEEES